MKTAPSHRDCLNALMRIERLLFEKGPGSTKRKQQVMNLLATINDYEVVTHSIMNGAEIVIAARAVGTCSDPGTERYWSM